LFARFSRAQATLKDGIKGSGLGLSIVLGLAEANGGSAWYEPNHPKGSCFGLKLPNAAA
jgi:two-component system sensor histidine kinase BaeS